MGAAGERRAPYQPKQVESHCVSEREGGHFLPQRPVGKCNRRCDREEWERPSAVCDVIIVVAKFMVSTVEVSAFVDAIREQWENAFRVSTEFIVPTGERSDKPERNAITHTHGCASRGANA
jgi:hypothetical protein